MNLEQLLNEPTLVEIKIDKPRIVEKYGEAPSFWIYDRQDMETYMALTKISGDDDDLFALDEIVKKLVRNEKGKLILDSKKQLPTDLQIAVIEETVKTLGNLMAQTLETQVEK